MSNERDDTSVSAQYQTTAFPTGKDWRFMAQSHTGNLYLDTYSEQPVTRFAYDVNGQRTLTIAADGDETHFPYPTYTVVEPGEASEETRSAYLIAGKVAAIRVQTTSTDVIYYPHADHLGSTLEMTDENGTDISGATTRHLPYGDYRKTPSAPISDRGYTGHRENMSEVGLVYMRARWFAPGLGRFLSADTIVPSPGNPQAYNRFTYVLGNPTNQVDPSGHCNLSPEAQGVCIIPSHPGSPTTLFIFDPEIDILKGIVPFAPPLRPIEPIGRGVNLPPNAGVIHHGVDYAREEGTPIYGSGNGLVVVSEECVHEQPNCIFEGRETSAAANGGYGHVLIVEYAYDSLPADVIDEYDLSPSQSLFVLTAHMYEPSALEVGTIVDKDTVLGGVGNTGWSTGNHLHLEIRKGASGLLWANQGEGYNAWRRVWWTELQIMDPNQIWR